MKRLILPFPVWVGIAILVMVSTVITQCRYNTITAWKGNCSAKEVNTDKTGAYLQLSCPGFGYGAATYTRQGVVVERAAKAKLPAGFWCEVTRSGDANCVIPEK